MIGLAETSPLYPRLIGLVVLAYLLGSIPFGLLIGFAKGVDLRKEGSGNIGATNAGRLLGKKYFIMALILDVLKGFLPTVIAGGMLKSYHLFEVGGALACGLWLIVGFAAVAGHNWPCWLNFKGGKGVATSLGIVLAIYPYYTWPGLAGLVIWIVLVRISGYVSVGSMVAGLTFLLVLILLFALHDTWRVADHWPLLAFASLMVAMLMFRHRGNIARLRSGTENKFISARGSEQR